MAGHMSPKLFEDINMFIRFLRGKLKLINIFLNVVNVKIDNTYENLFHNISNFTYAVQWLLLEYWYDIKHQLILNIHISFSSNMRFTVWCNLWSQLLGLRLGSIISERVIRDQFLLPSEKCPIIYYDIGENIYISF